MNGSRISLDAWAMGMVRVTARRSTCLRRAVGCVLMDEDGFVLATGYNGVPSGFPHCNDKGPGEIQPLGDERHGYAYPNACPGHDSPSGSNLSGCHAIHAEQNALLRVRDPREVHTCYVSASPCIQCVKMLLNTNCRRIVFDELYPHHDSQKLWEAMGHDWIKYEGK